MREIKFRAIHKLTKKKWDEEELVFHSGKWYENWRAFEDGIPLNLQQCAVMEYTGLKDKNGVEIYEGDILSWDEKEFGRKYNELVSWSYEQLYMRDRDWQQFTEVIGNIYENPELLEGAK